MVWVDGSDRGFEPLVEGWKSNVFGVSRFVDGVVPGDPCVVFVAGCNLLPKPDCAVLMVFVVPVDMLLGVIHFLVYGRKRCQIAP